MSGSVPQRRLSVNYLNLSRFTAPVVFLGPILIFVWVPLHGKIREVIEQPLAFLVGLMLLVLIVFPVGLLIDRVVRWLER